MPKYICRESEEEEEEEEEEKEEEEEEEEECVWDRLSKHYQALCLPVMVV